ncbi:MAG: hypothetical protein L3J79_01940 [Candidatus Marinimicrobia bacterium]|nr:hypothetical protein [Candidatus Neomarinimicrobiota bacterium]
MILQVIAFIAFATGALLVFTPNLLIRAGEFFNQTYNVESFVYSQRKPFGAAFILIGLVFIWVTW